MTQQPFWSSRTGAAVRLSLHLGYASSSAPPAARRATSSRGGRPTQDFREPKRQAKPFIHVNGANKTIKLKMRAGSVFPLLGEPEPRGANQRGAAGEHVTGWRGSPISFQKLETGDGPARTIAPWPVREAGWPRRDKKRFGFGSSFFLLAFLDRRSINRLIIGLVVVGAFACCCCWPPPPRCIATYSCLHLPYMHITPPPTINPPDPRPSRTRRPP